MISNKIFNEILIDTGKVRLIGNLSPHSSSTGIVIFSHGSESRRHSSSINFVADELNRKGISTHLAK